MKNIFLLLIAISILSSCRTSQPMLTRDQRIAQRKLKKAIEHDPTIIQKQSIDTTIKGVATGIVDDTFKAVTVQFQPYPCDSIQSALDSMISINRSVGVDTGAIITLYMDSMVKVSMRKDKSGKVTETVNVGQQVHADTVKVPYEVKVSVPGKLIVKYAEYPCTHYKWFWGMLAGLISLLILFIAGITGRLSKL